MSSFLPVEPLDGAAGYLRWKESVLLRLNTVGVAHVLTDDDPPSRRNKGASTEASKQWARDDAVCRGHILATLSDRLLPDYVRHATGKALWEAVARTYDVETAGIQFLQCKEFLFDPDAPLLEQVAHVEALAAAASYNSDKLMAYTLSDKLLRDVGIYVAFEPSKGGVCMDRVWDVARKQVVHSIISQLLPKEEEQEKESVHWHNAKKRKA